MLDDLYLGKVQLPAPCPNEQEWDFLLSQWPDNSVSFFIDSYTERGPVWHIQESCDKFSFDMTRNIVSGDRITNRNDLGCVGFSLIDPNKRKVIITEGVSDYFTVKMLCPDSNVLGFTSLSGNSRARAIVLSLFDNILYCHDNDQAGIDGAFKVKTFFESYGKSVKFFTPPTPYKDVTEAAMKIAALNAV